MTKTASPQEQNSTQYPKFLFRHAESTINIAPQAYILIRGISPMRRPYEGDQGIADTDCGVILSHGMVPAGETGPFPSARNPRAIAGILVSRREEPLSCVTLGQRAVRIRPRPTRNHPAMKKIYRWSRPEHLSCIQDYDIIAGHGAGRPTGEESDRTNHPHPAAIGVNEIFLIS